MGGYGTTVEMRGSTAARAKKAYQQLREKLNVTHYQ